MTGTNVPPPLLPSHIEETIRLIARLHAEHHQSATPLQRAVDRMTALLGHPRFIGALTVIVAGWISLNLLAATLSYHPIDPPPFSWLGCAVSLVSLYMVVLILATQRARGSACPTSRAAHFGVGNLERAEDDEGDPTAGRIPSG